MKQAQLLLNVPFAAKDQAKGLGARWDPQQRSWYVPLGADIQPFAPWWPEDLKAQGGEVMQQVRKIDAPGARQPGARQPGARQPGARQPGAARQPAAAKTTAAIFTGPAEVADDPSGKLPWED
jgi:hypothetical protein